MRLSSFMYGLVLGLFVSVGFELYQAAMIPYKRGEIVAGVLRRDLSRIEESTSRREAIDKATHWMTQCSEVFRWGEKLPPIITENTITLRVGKPLMKNINVVIEGTVKLPSMEN